MSNAKDTWAKVCKHLRSLLNADTYDRWIAGIVPLDSGPGKVLLGVPNAMFCEWLTLNYRDLITSVVSQVTGTEHEVVFETGHESLDVPRTRDSAGTKAKPKAGGAAPDRYNRRFSFDAFVVGENNKFAYAACYAVAKSPGKTYNPLFIYGPTGLGKTHLLQAIAQEVEGRRRRARIEYLSSEEFTNGFIEALRDRALPKFRRHYRSVDLLLIDDVHFFKDKEQLQEEFFHTFNALYNARKQIVLTSDRPPHEIGGLEKRLVSRFEWGLTSEILLPDLETRIAILRKKQSDHAVKLPDDVINFIASRVKSNVRRLEGALIRLVSYASVTQAAVTVEVAEQLLGPLLDEEAKSQITVAQIQRAVAEYYDIRLADMTSKRRPQNIAFPRQVAMFLCRRLTDFSSPIIAECFNRNHATVLHAAATVEKRLSGNPEVRREIQLLERRIKA